MMTNLPADLSPESAAWMHAQIAISSARSISLLRAEIDKVDDWANGLFVVFSTLLPPLLRAQPELASQLAPQWQQAAQRFDVLQANNARRTDDGETLEVLEARKMLYRVLESLKMWPR